MAELELVQRFDPREEKKTIRKLQRAFAGEEGRKFLEAIAAVEKDDPELADQLKEALEDIKHGRMRRVA